MHVERNRIWVAVKNFPLSWLLMAPFYTMKRYLFQFYGIITGGGSAARFRESNSAKDLALAIAGAYIAALKGLPAMLGKRRKLKRAMGGKEFVKILKKHRISVSELVLRD